MSYPPPSSSTSLPRGAPCWIEPAINARRPWAREREAPGFGFLPRHAGTRDWLGAANDEWQRKGATLSDKTAGQEFGLTQGEIYDAIDAGTLQYRQAYMHGNPWLRPLRREVEALARTRRGDPLRQRTAGQGGADARQPRDQAPADRAGRTPGAASQAQLRSRRVNGPASNCAASHASRSSRS